MSTVIGTRKNGPLSSWMAHAPLGNVGQEVEQMLERFWSGNDHLQSEILAPAIDICESDNSFKVKLDVPGIQAKDIEVQLNHNQLTISGERKESKEEKGETYHRIERKTGKFFRTIALPSPVEEKKVEASYEDGVLVVTLPKSETARVHRIQVRS